MSALWLVVGVLGQKMLLQLLHFPWARLAADSPFVWSATFGCFSGWASDGGSGGSIVVSVVLVELEGSWLMTSILLSE